MRYKLRTLLILLAMGPPLLADAWFAVGGGVGAAVLGITAGVLLCFALFWFACGLLWQSLVQAVAPYLNDDQQ